MKYNMENGMFNLGNIKSDDMQFINIANEKVLDELTNLLVKISNCDKLTIGSINIMNVGVNANSDEYSLSFVCTDVKLVDKYIDVITTNHISKSNADLIIRTMCDNVIQIIMASLPNNMFISKDSSKISLNVEFENSAFIVRFDSYNKVEENTQEVK